MVVNFRGRRTCECVAISLPLVEQSMKNKNIIKSNIDIHQMGYNQGGVTASAGTHDGGGAVDVGQFSYAALKEWREWGWCMQERTEAEGFDPHGHGWPKGCTHGSSGLRYQMSEWEKGRNGLRNRGPIRGPGPKGSATPTWKQGIVNHRPAPVVGGVLGMSTITKFGNTKSQDFTGNGKWQTVKLDDKGTFSFVTGPKPLYIVMTGLTLANLSVGQVCQLRYIAVSDFIADKPTVTEYSYPINEILGTSGQTFANMSWMNSLGSSPKGAGAKLRLRLAINPPQGVKISVVNMGSRISY